MPRPKKGSPEAKEWAADMKAKREAKKQKDQQETKQEAVHSNEDIAELRRQIEELKKGQFFSPPVQQAIRAITKYSISAEDYPDPRQRLSDEPRLAEHAFKQNFFLEWEVNKVRYEHDGVSYTEPRFVLQVWRWIRDPETNELTKKSYRVHKGTFFQDPDAAIQAAHDAGQEVDEEVKKPFLDEMRYLRMRDWLFEIFYPQPAKPVRGIREEVIGNRLVPVMEMSSTEPLNMFDKLGQ